PTLRGKYRSRDEDSVVTEAERLAAAGVRELLLISQDTTFFGVDRGRRGALASLLRRLNQIDGLEWIRLLYLYPTTITDDVLDAMAECDKVCKYVDLPLQHASADVLRRMRRPGQRAAYDKLLARIRARVPGVSLRTTFIVGFPGETESDFEQLCDLLEEVRFERVGAFTYSPQEGTAGALLDDDVPMPVKRDRLERLTELQRAITAERYERHIGQRVRGIIDRVDEVSGETVGRLIWQADDIDGISRFDGDAAPGSIVDAIVQDVVDDYDFIARIVHVHDSPAATPRLARVGRSLPVMAAATTASYGR
ncbi:MAG TPA: MiaB/RimO family radical SAM methylthiotransferase, partial [Gemmatimonadaceae bacterium]